jgi:hypothetical protein
VEVRVRSLEKYGIDAGVAQKYAESLDRHIACIREAGAALGVSARQLREHDVSKWSQAEFPFYADWFYGSRANPAGFERAFLHHIHQNPHHWQHWSFTSGFTGWSGGLEDGLIQMPDEYVLEMVADWQASSVAYSGHSDMSAWLSANLSKVKLHSKSRERLIKILRQLGYNIAQQTQE